MLLHPILLRANDYSCFHYTPLHCQSKALLCTQGTRDKLFIMGKEIHELRAEEFPAQLLEISDPPKQLWCEGVLPAPETVLLTVVGSRKYTSYGKEICETLIGGLSGYDIAIISGLALGIDAIAHESAMKAGLKTIAVPGSGLDEKVLYPRSNVGLAKRILGAGGALLSEFPPDTPPAPWTFPKRNRIMAGLGKATLLIEASEHSGTLITARLAVVYNRELLVVPGSIFAPNSAGTHQFLKLGATPVTNAEDILRALGFTPSSDAPAREVNWDSLAPDERLVMEALSETKYRDLLLLELGLSASEGNVLLMKMEIAGLITETPEGLRRT